MKQITNTILMIRPVSFRMNEQTAVNNYYQKVLENLTPETLQLRALQEFDNFVIKLRKIGVDVIVGVFVDVVVTVGVGVKVEHNAPNPWGTPPELRFTTYALFW